MKSSTNSLKIRTEEIYLQVPNAKCLFKKSGDPAFSAIYAQQRCLSEWKSKRRIRFSALFTLPFSSRQSSSVFCYSLLRSQGRIWLKFQRLNFVQGWESLLPRNTPNAYSHVSALLWPEFDPDSRLWSRFSQHDDLSRHCLFILRRFGVYVLAWHFSFSPPKNQGKNDFV